MPEALGILYQHSASALKKIFRHNFEVGKRVKERPTLLEHSWDLSMHTDELRIVESKVMSTEANVCVFFLRV